MMVFFLSETDSNDYVVHLFVFLYLVPLHSVENKYNGTGVEQTILYMLKQGFQISPVCLTFSTAKIAFVLLNLLISRLLF